jgi:hypothetical protein
VPPASEVQPLVLSALGGESEEEKDDANTTVLLYNTGTVVVFRSIDAPAAQGQFALGQLVQDCEDLGAQSIMDVAVYSDILTRSGVFEMMGSVHHLAPHLVVTTVDPSKITLGNEVQLITLDAAEYDAIIDLLSPQPESDDDDAPDPGSDSDDDSNHNGVYRVREGKPLPTALEVTTHTHSWLGV